MPSTRTKGSPRPSGKLAIGVCVEEPLLLRRTCSAIAAGGHRVFARTTAIDELLDSCNGETPECVVLGIKRPDRDALAQLGQVRSRLAGVASVLVCERASASEVRRALELGASGVVLVEELDDALPAVIAVVCVGQVSVPGDNRSQVHAPVLTTREKQILSLVVMGLSNGEIARKLYLAESTVKSHLSSAFSKLRVSSSNEAVSVILDPDRGRALGIITIPAEQIRSPI